MPGPLFSALPDANGLYDPRHEHDACGVAMVATLRGRAGHDIVQAALEALRAHEAVDPDRTGLLGFCYGGGLAVSATAAAAAEGRAPAALISYYGSALPTLLDRAAGIEVPSLHHFGTADAFIPLEQVTEIRRAVTADGSREQVRFHLHDGAGHAFDNPHPGLHHAQAAEAAWEQTTAFLAETLHPHG